jgi:hypothetical protein
MAWKSLLRQLVISFGIWTYRCPPVQTVFGEISEISAEKKTPDTAKTKGKVSTKISIILDQFRTPRLTNLGRYLWYFDQYFRYLRKPDFSLSTGISACSVECFHEETY